MLEGGAIDQQALQSILKSASNAGIAILPPPGASLSEINQMLINGAAERGLPIQAATIQNFVNRAVGGRKWPATVSDRDGRFTFRDVQLADTPCGRRATVISGSLLVERFEPSAFIDVAVRGKDMQEAPISMVQGAIVGGRISDATGEVSANVTVQAFSVGYANGYAQLESSVSTTTDEHGEYRLLWIPPGDYYVGVTPRAGTLRDFRPR